MNNKQSISPIVGIVMGIVFHEIASGLLYFGFPIIYSSFIRGIGILLVALYFYKASYSQLEGTISFVYKLMMFWTIIILARGRLIGNYLPGVETSLGESIKSALLSPMGGLAFLLPYVALIKPDLRAFFYFRKIAIPLCVVFLFLILIFREQIIFGLASSGLTQMIGMDGDEMSVRQLARALFPGFGLVLFILLCFNYIKNKSAIILPFSLVFFFIIYAIGGGRGQTGFNILYIFLFFLVIIKYPLPSGIKTDNRRTNKRITYLFLATLLILFVSYLYFSTSTFDFLLERSFGEKTISGEFINEDRDVLVNDMVTDFNNSPLDWVWGRGVNGTYASTFESINGRRAWMEWGGLFLILKGGIIYLFLYVYCMLNAFYKGFYKSNNVLSKCLALMCLVLLVNLLSTGAEPQYSTLFVMSWFSFGLLERKEIRYLSDAHVYDCFNHKRRNTLAN